MAGRLYDTESRIRKNLSIGELILSSYMSEGMDFISGLNGNFLLAIIDRNKEKVYVANDRYGLIKLFYAQANDIVVFAPKIGPLINLSFIDKKLRKDAVFDFFLFGYLLGDSTLIEGVSQLPPATIMEISLDTFSVATEKYWEHAYSYPDDGGSATVGDLIDGMTERLEESIARRVQKEDRVIIPLSGGLDSRAILSAALGCIPKERITTFTFGDRGTLDFEIGPRIAKEAGVENIIVPPERSDFERYYWEALDDIEAMVDLTPYFPLEGYRRVVEHGNKLIIGYMGDPIMGSHITPTMLNKRLKSAEDFELAANMIFDNNILNDKKTVKNLFTPGFLDGVHLNGLFKDTIDELKAHNPNHLADFCAIWDYRHRQDKYTLFTVLRNRQLFEYRPPFIDNELTDFMLRVPIEYRLGQKLYMNTLLARYPSLFRLPTKNLMGNGLGVGDGRLLLSRIRFFLKGRANKTLRRLLGRNVFKDKMKNYIDYDDLLRTSEEYREFVREYLNRVKGREMFDGAYIDGLWKAHMTGRADHAKLFGLLVSFEMFSERFLDSQDRV